MHANVWIAPSLCIFSWTENSLCVSTLPSILEAEYKMCDAIKQTESEVEKWSIRFFFCFVFWHFLLRYYVSFNFVKTPCRLSYWFKIYEQLKRCKNNKKKKTYLLCLTISQNQYLRVATHFAWSHHICILTDLTSFCIVSTALLSCLC